MQRSIKERALTLLDGGMGQELLRLSGRKPTPLWSADVMLNEPDIVRDLHGSFIDSGARVITLNTYAATPERLCNQGALHHLEPLHAAAQVAARDAVALSGRSDVAIAGCLPPLVASFRPDVAPEFDQSLASYRRLVQIQAPGSDLFLCETMGSITEARAAATAGLESGKPVWLSLTVSDEHPGQLRSGEDLRTALGELQGLGIDAVLLNCSFPESITACWPLLQNIKPRYGAYANAFTSVAALAPGGTVDTLNARDDLDPGAYAEHAIYWVENGASIVGGCCEVGPAHIAELNARLVRAGRLD